MRKSNLLSMLITFVMFSVLSATATSQAVSIDIYATGVDNNHNVIADSTVDPHWQVTQSADSSYPGPNAYVVRSDIFPISTGNWLANSSSSKWISVRSAQDVGVAPGTYIYTQTFDLTSLDPATAQLSGKFSSDDTLSYIKLNGINKGQGGGAFNTWSNFSITSGFTSGINTLSFYVVNGDSGTNPSGFRAEVTGTADEILLPPGMAANPTPTDDATGISVHAVLSWTAGIDAASHNVYFGTDSTPDAGESKGNRTGTSYDPGTLSYDTTYYWRIDEVNSSGTTTGTTWTFTTEQQPVLSSNPTPVDDAMYVSADTVLSWTAGAGAISHNVYFGTDLSSVTNALRLEGDINGDGPVNIDDLIVLAQNWLTSTDLEGFAGLAADWGQSGTPEFKGNQAGTTYDPGILSEGTYYWRIDEVKTDGTTTGTVWNFTAGTIPVILNPSFEYPDVSGYQYAPTESDWNHTGTGFVIAEEGFYITTGTGTSPNDGDQILILEEIASISQDISGFMPGHSYKISWVEADDNNNSIHVLIDSTVIWDATPVTNNDWVLQTSDTFTATATTHTLTFEGTDDWNQAHATVLIDSIGIVEVGVAPTAASYLSPTYAASDVPSSSAVLSWTAGAGATSHNVYFGTDPSPDAGEFQGNQVGTSYNTGILNEYTTYYWRIDEVNDYGTTAGPIWRFTTIPTKYFGYLYTYFDWYGGGQLNDIPAVAGYTNMNHLLVYPGDTTNGIQSAIANGTKVLVDVKFLCFEEPSYHDFDLRSDWQSQLNTFKAQYNQYKDHIAALTPMDEPYWHGVTESEVQQVATKLRADFPGIPIYLNLYKDGWGGMDLYHRTSSSYPGIDWVAFDTFDGHTFDYNEFVNLLNHLKAIKTPSQKIILNIPNMSESGTDAQIASWNWDIYNNLMKNDDEVIGALIWLGDTYRIVTYPNHPETPLPANKVALEDIGKLITGK